MHLKVHRWAIENFIDTKSLEGIKPKHLVAFYKLKKTIDVHQVYIEEEIVRAFWVDIEVDNEMQLFKKIRVNVDGPVTFDTVCIHDTRGRILFSASMHQIFLGENYTYALTLELMQ